MAQTTLISFFKYSGVKNKWEALARMGRPPILEKKISGLSFFKPLGTGSGNGFSIKPIYVKQGNYPRAIQIYEQLMLSNPEKKLFFASRIKYIKLKTQP